jgi:ferredoxin
LCGVCHVRVIASSAPLPPPSALERGAWKLIPAHKQGPDMRLACQLSVNGEITVERVGVVRPANP